MKIDYVNLANLELLIGAYQNGIRNDEGITKDFGKNLSKLLSHITISFDVSEVSILEAVMLKKFSNSEIIDHETLLEDNNIDAKQFPDARQGLRSLLLINENMEEDSDITTKPGPVFLPLKAIQKKITVSFSGMNILNIIGEISRLPTCFCARVFTKLEELNEDDDDPEEMIKNLLIEDFIKSFYTYLSYSYNYIDVLSDSVLESEYLSKAKAKDMCVLTHVNTLFGMIPFNDTDEDSLSSALTLFKENKENYMKVTEVNVNEDMIRLTTDIYFTCVSSFYSFLEAYLYLPIGSIQEYTDIKILFHSNTFIIPGEMEKYQVRLSNILSRYYTWMQNYKEEEKKTNLDKYSMILGNVEVRYVIKLSLSNISNILLGWRELITKDKIYGDENGYIVKELLKIIDAMKRYTIAVFNTIRK